MSLHTIATVVLYLTTAYAGLVTVLLMIAAWNQAFSEERHERAAEQVLLFGKITIYPWKQHLLIFLALCLLLGLQQGWITY